MKGTSPSRAVCGACSVAQTGHEVPRWEGANSHRSTQLLKGEVREHFVRWNRPCQERVCAAPRQRSGQARAGASERGACQAARVGRRPAAECYRHGSVLGRAPLSEAVCGARPHGAADGAKVHRPLPTVGQARQERCGRCSSHL